jgi:pyrrolidone-carboxylate peptidase
MNRQAIRQISQGKETAIAGNVLHRQCACGAHTIAGGECAECGKKKSGLQRKLNIGASNDPLEQEADRIADQVMAAPAQSTASNAPLHIQRYAGQAPGQAETAPASVERVLASSGRSLEPNLQQDMEQRFNHDFSRVRVHIGSAAEQSARDINAHAYTVGHNIVFGARQFVPDGHEGRRLLAHELTHVVQQSNHFSSKAPTIQRKVDTSTIDNSSEALLDKLKTAHGGAEEKLPFTSEVLEWVTALRSGEVEPTEGEAKSKQSDTDPSKYPERRHKGAAFIWDEADRRAIDISDVDQGNLGDCYFMALLAAIAEMRPEAIEQMVKSNGDGSFTVSFFAPDGKRVHQIVQPTFPTGQWGEPEFAQFGDQSDIYGKELWPMLIEKAWMQANGSWLDIEGGKVNSTKHAIAMTGSDKEDFNLPGKLSDEELFDRLLQHFRAKQPVTIRSPKDGESRKKISTSSAVISNHVYALRKVYPDSKTLDLHNPHGPDSQHLLGKDVAFLKSNFATIKFFKLKDPGLSTTRGNATKEEQLASELIPKQILKDSGYDLLVAEFEKQLSMSSSQGLARDAVQKFGEKLWEHSKTRAQDAKKPDTDDRPLYWARLATSTFIRSFVPTSYNLTPAEKQILLDMLEATSRGRTSINFPIATTGGARRILISGFDPFELRALGPRKANPSGAAVLALDGQTIPAPPGGREGRVEGVIFPVRFADFDQGIVESTFRPYVKNSTNKVAMIMTISQGGSTLKTSDPVNKQSKAFELERYAGRHRAPSGTDNNEFDPVGRSGLKEGKGLSKGPEFLESSLPRKDMSGREETEAESKKERATTGEEVGSGGGFLSNEIFYRTALLRADEKSTVPVGHLHVPNLPAPTGTPASEKEHTKLRDSIVQWVKKLISNALKSMGMG